MTDDGVPETAEEWAAYRAFLDQRPMREWSAAEEKAYIRGVLADLNAHFRRFYGPSIDSLVNARHPFA